MQIGPEILARRLDMEEYVVEQVLAYDNVELYSFLDVILYLYRNSKTATESEIGHEI